MPGCSHCHGGKHRTTDGKVLDSRCKLCHFVRREADSESLIAVPSDASSVHLWTSIDAHNVACWRERTNYTQILQMRKR